LTSGGKVDLLLKRVRRRYGARKLEEILELAKNRVEAFNVERSPLTLSGIVKGSTEYSTYIDETGEYCCSCRGQNVHKTPCKHIVALVLHGYIDGDVSEDEVIDLIGGEIR
jgi:hypothetical protein